LEPKSRLGRDEGSLARPASQFIEWVNDGLWFFDFYHTNNDRQNFNMPNGTEIGKTIYESVWLRIELRLNFKSSLWRLSSSLILLNWWKIDFETEHSTDEWRKRWR
jgi:hypothetical protein